LLQLKELEKLKQFDLLFYPAVKRGKISVIYKTNNIEKSENGKTKLTKAAKPNIKIFSLFSFFVTFFLFSSFL
jgi:hypothetical protein